MASHAQLSASVCHLPPAAAAAAPPAAPAAAPVAGEACSRSRRNDTTPGMGRQGAAWGTKQYRGASRDRCLASYIMKEVQGTESIGRS